MDTAVCGVRATEPHHGCYWTTMAVNKNRLPRYEEEHDPWNAHLRIANSASSSDITYQTGLPEARPPCPSLRHVGPRDAAAATRLTDAMTYRYEQMAMLPTGYESYQPGNGTGAMVDQVSPTHTIETSPPHRTCTCKYCDSFCCLRKKGHAVHLCLIHKSREQD